MELKTKRFKMIKEILDPANVLTYIGLITAVLGMEFCYYEKVSYAIVCLIICGICDGFDGTFARKFRKPGNDHGKKYGIELDSLVDIVSSGVFPVMVCISMGFDKCYEIIIYCWFIICGVTRLAYYNVTVEDDGRNFTGVPITFSTILLPLLYIFTKNEFIYVGSMLVLSIAYITDFKIKKFNLREKIIVSIVGFVFIVYFILKTLNII